MPRLLNDIRELVQEQSQTDPTFRSTRLYLPGHRSRGEEAANLSNAKGYTGKELPSLQTITTKLNALGYHLTRVPKCRPQKKYPRPTPSSLS